MSTKANILPIQLILGDDVLKRNLVMSRLKERMEQDNDLSFDFDEFDASVTPVTQVLSACECYPMIAEKRLVVLKNLDSYKKADYEQLLQYAQAPNELCVLAIEANKLAKNTKLYKAIAKIGKTAIIECSTPDSSGLQRLVLDISKQSDATFSPAAAATLVELVGPNTLLLNNETRKICSVLSQKKKVDVQDVLELVNNTAESKIWKFIDFLSCRDAAKSMEWLSQAQSVSVYALIPSCYQRIRELLITKTLDRQGKLSQLASELKIDSKMSWKLKNHAKFSRNFSEVELVCGLSDLCQFEEALKTGKKTEQDFSIWLLNFLA